MGAPKWWSCHNTVAPEEWKVQINRNVRHHFAAGGFTSTTKYNVVTFLPKALFEQFRRIANVYFAVVAALSLTSFSPVRPWTTWTPLAIVVGVSIIKEAIEDYYRWRADKEVNNRKVDVLDSSLQIFISKSWRYVQAGDIVRVKKNEFFPADLLFLSAQNAEGSCYVETMNLDGETNLKIKVALDITKDLACDTVAAWTGTVHCEPPNARLYRFAGNLVVGEEKDGSPSNPIPVAVNSILLRGCSLRNTELILGAVIYSGHDTKVMQNSSEAPSKRSTLEYMIDSIVILMFIILFVMCLVTAVYFSWWLEDDYANHWYLKPMGEDPIGQYDPSNTGKAGAISFLVGFILYGYLIPISLYVSLEVVKVFQAMVLIRQDREMYHAETDTPASARTSNLNEDLGKVSVVLSDKTGTLTCNVMEFFKCSIGGISYGAGVTEVERSNLERKGITLPPADGEASSPYREQYFNFFDRRLMMGAWQKEGHADQVAMFFRSLAICQSVVPDGPPNEKELKYEAESPDEAALVVAAKVMGFFFYKRTNNSISVRESSSSGYNDVEYELLNVLEFSSTRKRMSVIVRDPQGQLILFCKGADSVIFERLDAAWGPNQETEEVSTLHLQEYGASGLRTLCLAYKEVDETWYKKWQAKWIAAKSSLTCGEEDLALLAEEAEGNLRLLGCTAIEDKLQAGVGPCIKQLADAGIRLWVLTGDKTETAINIAFACCLIDEEMSQVIISASNSDIDAMEELGNHEEAAALAHKHVEAQLRAAEANIREGREGNTEHVLIIDGKALSYALHDKLLPLTLSVGMSCKAAICCRVSPLQKAQVTSAVRSFGLVTLAIGDGANDVGMIQKAHIGIGISGQEGMQAVMASDFAIAQFRFLTPLLMVHGRWSYKRISRMVNYFFYKNMLFGVTLFVFNAFTRFSGSFFYDDTYMTLFNVVFTVLMPLVIGVLDRDVERSLGYRFPSLYQAGLDNSWFNTWAIGGWLVSSTVQPCITMALCLLATNPTIIDHREGHPASMYAAGVTTFSCILICVHAHLFYIIEEWTWIHHVGMWLGLALWWLFLVAYGDFSLWLSQALYKLFVGILATSPQYWLLLILVPVASLLPDFFFRMVKRHVAPDAHHLVAEHLWLERHRAKGTAKDPSRSLGGALAEGAPRPESSTAGTTGSRPNGASGVSGRASLEAVHELDEGQHRTGTPREPVPHLIGISCRKLSASSAQGQHSRSPSQAQLPEPRHSSRSMGPLPTTTISLPGSVSESVQSSLAGMIQGAAMANSIKDLSAPADLGLREAAKIEGQMETPRGEAQGRECTQGQRLQGDLEAATAITATATAATTAATTAVSTAAVTADGAAVSTAEATAEATAAAAAAAAAAGAVAMTTTTAGGSTTDAADAGQHISTPRSCQATEAAAAGDGATFSPQISQPQAVAGEGRRAAGTSSSSSSSAAAAAEGAAAAARGVAESATTLSSSPPQSAAVGVQFTSTPRSSASISPTPRTSEYCITRIPPDRHQLHAENDENNNNDTITTANNINNNNNSNEGDFSSSI